MSTRIRLTVPVVPPSLLRAAGDVKVIDLRSPAEFAEDHIPGAWNVPLFDDVERAVVGTLYTKKSPAAAFAEGRARTRAKIGELVRKIAGIAGWSVPNVDLEARVDALTEGGIDALDRGLESERVDALPEGALVCHCWRGGLRSRSVVTLLRELGLDRAVCLEHGYKAYRRDVIECIAAWSPPPVFVLRGLTGVGKTLVLRAIETLRPGWTLDLEGLAGHRSSILGMVGLEPVSQRRFESRLAHRLRAIGDHSSARACVVEGESRKVGDIILPASIWAALQGGASLELSASAEHRVDVLIRDYLASDANRGPLAVQLAFIETRLGKNQWNGKLVALLESGRERELVEILLGDYYDPLYGHSEKSYSYATSLNADDTDVCAAAIVDWIETALRERSFKTT